MSPERRRLRASLQVPLLIAGLLVSATPMLGVDLQEDTARAYEKYLQAAEGRMAREEQLPQRFLYIESLPQAQQRSIWATLKSGGVWAVPLAATDEKGQPITAPHGTITHWVGDIFFPGATLDQALAVLQDFDDFQRIYKPEITRSRLLARHDRTFQVAFRIYKDTPWVNPTFDVDTTVSVTPVDATHARIRTIATRIVQVENAGKPGEHEDSVGHDGGYLWRLDTYWRLEAREGGVLAEFEAITLSRDIPFLLRWLVRPFVIRLAGQTMRAQLVATRSEVEKRTHSAKPGP